MRKNRKKRNRSKNVGNTDAILRVVLGSVILVIGMIFETLWGLAGLILIVSGALSWCPIYYVLGLKSCKPNLEIEV